MILLLTTIVSAVSAEVVILKALGDLHSVSFYPAGSHGPCSGCLWSHGVEDGTVFHWQFVEDWGCLVANWTTHCDTDGLRYEGHWNNSFQGIYGPWSVNLDAHLTCLIEVSAPTLLVANRYVDGNITQNEHTVILIHPDEFTDVLLGSDLEVNEAERQLRGGLYRITIALNVGYIGLDPFDYTGIVQAVWESGTERSGTTWGEVKALYH